MEFREGKVVHETQYFADSFEAPAWRSQWVERMPASSGLMGRALNCPAKTD
jgi:hypothetical protein